MSSITTIQGTDIIANSRTDINTNFSNLNTDKIETSVLDTDTSLAANSDAKIATQKAVKAYVDGVGTPNASTTVRGLVEEATSAEMIAGTGTGGTGARLFINPTLVSETGVDKVVKTKSTGLLDPSIVVASKKVLLSTTEITLATTGETTLFTGSIPGGTLGTSNALRITAYFSAMSFGAGDTLTLNLKYGGTYIATKVNTSPQAVDVRMLCFTGYVVADGATNAQKGALVFFGGDSINEVAGAASVQSSKWIGGGSGSATVDSTANQTLILSAQWNDTSATLTAEFWIVEVIS